jgi:hypothetical protein
VIGLKPELGNEANWALDTGEAKTRFQAADLASEAADLASEFRYRSGISGKQPLYWERLTDGELTNVPRSHGQWAGYRTTKAVAWVICVAPGQWLARCGDRACGPEPINKAKTDALAMAKGAAGDYKICNPVAHLNGLQ